MPAYLANYIYRVFWTNCLLFWICEAFVFVFVILYAMQSELHATPNIVSHFSLFIGIFVSAVVVHLVGTVYAQLKRYLGFSRSAYQFELRSWESAKNSVSFVSMSALDSVAFSMRLFFCWRSFFVECVYIFA